ncbi:MAG TPA: M20/M25/M40 family metallo-hydrolase [Chloroflexota bacterium]|nr:M20/M25/M40 family metallo-hydrolase [Chloroflexota bacterium]
MSCFLYSAAVRAVDILSALSACPTAPLHEEYVARRILALCREFGLAVTSDAYGNLYVRPPRRSSSAGGVPLALVAHMDHPALEVVSTDPPVGRLLGGVNAKCFERPIPVRLIGRDRETRGRIVSRREEEDGVMLALEVDSPIPPGAFGVFDVEAFREDGETLHGPAMDDLAGCAAILAALSDCAARGMDGDVVGVFTRAEEVGLTGATLVAREGLLPKSTLVVSLEASRALPGAEQGGGPVIRVGDRTAAFHPEGEALLRRAAAQLAERTPAVPVQRQLMAGGTCEATAFATFGYVATGVALPLGNYHNVSPEMRIEAEYIHRQDLLGAVELLVATVDAAGSEAGPDPVRTRLTTRADAMAARLRESREGWRIDG